MQEENSHGGGKNHKDFRENTELLKDISKVRDDDTNLSSRDPEISSRITGIDINLRDSLTKNSASGSEIHIEKFKM